MGGRHSGAFVLLMASAYVRGMSSPVAVAAYARISSGGIAIGDSVASAKRAFCDSRALSDGTTVRPERVVVEVLEAGVEREDPGTDECGDPGAAEPPRVVPRRREPPRDGPDGEDPVTGGGMFDAVLRTGEGGISKGVCGSSIFAGPGLGWRISSRLVETTGRT